MEEKDLTQKQREWLEASKKIGLGPKTKSERQNLEKLYADMLPAEQQQLREYIEDTFGDRFDEQPILEQKDKQYAEPSKGLKSILTKPQSSKLPKDDAGD